MKLVKFWRVVGSIFTPELFGGLALNGPAQSPLLTLTYGAAPVMDASLGNWFVMTVTDNVAFVVGAPTNPPPSGQSQDLYLTIRNASGGAHGAGTWNAAFLVTGAVPAIANGFSRTFGFRWNGTNWVQFLVPATDIPN